MDQAETTKPRASSLGTAPESHRVNADALPVVSPAFAVSVDGILQESWSLLVPTISTAEPSIDDEVQFIFSVPRRKKRKRKRIESDRESLDDIRKLSTLREYSTLPTTSSLQHQGSGTGTCPVNSCYLSENDKSMSQGIGNSLTASKLDQSLEPLALSPTSVPAKDNSWPASSSTCSTSILCPNSPTQQFQSFSFPQGCWGVDSGYTSGVKRKRDDSGIERATPSSIQYTQGNANTRSNSVSAVSESNHFPAKNVGRLETSTQSRRQSMFDRIFPGMRTIGVPRTWNDNLSQPLMAFAPTSTHSTNQLPVNMPSHIVSQQQYPSVSIAPVQDQINVSQMQCHASDIRRKPSLYRVPPWTPLPAGISRLNPAISHQRSTNWHRDPEYQLRSLQVSTLPTLGQNPDQSLQSEKQPQFVVQPELHPNTLPGHPSMFQFSPSQYTQVCPAATQPRFSNAGIVTKSKNLTTAQSTTVTNPPGPRPLTSIPYNKNSISSISPSSRSHSPNLIVDIAQTCQEYFPFELVAQRHNTKIQRVFDTFSAIIQIPLLRSANDSRRSGPLGSLRMKEFRDAKKAAKKSHEADRKEQRQQAKSSNYKNSSGQKAAANNPGLLKAAILNSVREAQAGIQ